MLVSELLNHDLAIVDLETTGLYPGGTDRVVEIAVLRVQRGQTSMVFETLVNPQRDLGPVGIHGIRGADVKSAPIFRDIAGDVLDRIRGAVIVGHNIRFDFGFLAAEFRRLGYELPEFPLLCTMQLGAHLGLARSRGLASCCCELGIPVVPNHSARTDAEATLALLMHYVQSASGCGRKEVRWIGPSMPPPCPPYDSMETAGRCLPRGDARQAAQKERGYLARLVAQLPPQGEAGPSSGDNADAYLEVLDRALEDRRITSAEADGLHALALDLGLSSANVRALHQRYLEALVVVAVADGVVTSAEHRDLLRVGSLLGVNDEDVVSLLRTAEANPDRTRPSCQSCTERLQGRTVCFTGELEHIVGGQPVGRERAEALARTAGLVVLSSVTKKLDLLVVADPDSLSGKARKAIDYQIRIVAEPVFWSWLGLQ